MRDIAFDPPTLQIPQNTFLTYGDTRTGKSEFGATFPRPLIIADSRERGYETVMKMDRSKWWEPDLIPIIKSADSMSDIAEIINFAKPLIASGRILTIDFDAFTFYCDFALSQLMTQMAGADNRQIYGKLGTHLQYVRNEMHNLPVNVVWNCLAAAPEKDDNGTMKMGGPMIPGSQGPKYAAGVNFLFYTKMMQRKDKGVVVDESFNLYTKQEGMFAAGNRLGLNALPNPFKMGTYAELLPWLGYDVDAVKKAMKPLPAPNGKVSVPVSRPVTPPITRPAPKAVSPTGK